MPTQSADVIELNDGINDALREVIERYVDAKHLIDDLSYRKGAKIVAGEMANDSYGPKCGLGFFIKTFPFISQNSDVPQGEEFFALVPTRQVIGMSYRWTPSSVTDKDVLLKHLQTLHLKDAKHIEIAEYFWIKPLGLFLASEGKNRVAFFRAMGCEHIPAKVITCEYPAARRLVMYRVTLLGNKEWLIVRDNRLAELLEHVRCSYPVLSQYGVVESDVWPEDYPPVALVLEDCYSAIKSLRGMYSVDLQGKKYVTAKHQGWWQRLKAA